MQFAGMRGTRRVHLDPVARARLSSSCVNCLIFRAVLLLGEWPFACYNKARGLPLPSNALELDETVVRQILAYFVRSRRVADTLEGIARWRLLEERVRLSVRQTQAALNFPLD